MKAVLYLGIVLGIVGVLLLGYGTKLVQDGESTMESASEHKDSDSGRFTSEKYNIEYKAGEGERKTGLIVESFVQPVLFLALVIELAGIGFSVRESMGVKKP